MLFKRYGLLGFIDKKCFHEKWYNTETERDKDELDMTRLYGSRAGFWTHKIELKVSTHSKAT